MGGASALGSLARRKVYHKCSRMTGVFGGGACVTTRWIAGGAANRPREVRTTNIEKELGSEEWRNEGMEEHNGEGSSGKERISVGAR